MAILIEKATHIVSPGAKPELIDEYIGRVNSKTAEVSVAHMHCPSGWVKPPQRTEFNEYKIVLSGILHVKHEGGELDVNAGQAVIAKRGEWVQYSTPAEKGAEYIAVCVPAFSIDVVHSEPEIS